MDHGIAMASLVERHGWIEWSCHSHFSFKMGASYPHELIERAHALGYLGLAMTDMDGVYGLARSWRAWRDLEKSQSKGGRPRLLYGAELRLGSDEHDRPVMLQDTLILIAMNGRGYANLCSLLSLAHREIKHRAFVSLDQLVTCDLSDLVAVQPMRGLVHRAGMKGQWQEKCRRLRDVMGVERFFLTLSGLANKTEDDALERTQELAERLRVKCLLTQDVFFHRRELKDLSDLLHAVRTCRTLEESADQFFVNGERSMLSLEEIENRYRGLRSYEQALATGAELLSNISFCLSSLRYSYPREMLPPGKSAQEYLEEVTWQGARSIYGEIPQKISALLSHELALVDRLKFADYFLTVWDIVRWARSQGILCQGRGSAANSAICFVLGVTSVDPSQFDLLFERFISVERGDPPDIDVDFEHERREEVIQYIYGRYGRMRAAMVANVITWREKGALAAVGKALGLSDEVRAREGDCRWNQWRELARRLEGFPSHLGIHSGGFILSDRSLDCLCAQEPATMSGRSVIQWSKEDVEALGFFKIDVLALGMLSAVRKCLSRVRSHYGVDLTLASIPHGDEATYDMICRADTMGTFQIESRAQMSMLPRLRPRCFYDLVIEVAIIRPGPIQGGMIHPFLARREGREAVTFPDPRLQPILQRTLGVPIFQEQVMRVAMAVGGFTPGEANELRRHMGSFAMKGDVDQWIGKLADGMRREGLAEEFVQGILGQLKGFASYGFPESHAASFALIAYASCYLKCHFPEAFYESLLNSQPMGFYTPHVLLQAARHAGIEVREVCVERSEWDYSLEAAHESGNGGDSGQRPRYALRLGLRCVRGLAEGPTRRWLERRKGRQGWGRWEDFVRESGVGRRDLAALATADGLRCFGLARRSAVWLGGAVPLSPIDCEETLEFEAESQAERAQTDFHSMGTSLGPHPVALIRESDWCYDLDVSKISLSKELSTLGRGRGVWVFGMVTVRQSPPTAHGMVFVTLEDDVGWINLVFSPDVADRFGGVLWGHGFLCVHGVMQKHGEACSVRVRDVIEPRQSVWGRRDSQTGAHPLA